MPPILHRFTLADGLWQKTRLLVWFFALQGQKRLLRRRNPQRLSTFRFRWKQEPFLFTLKTILDLHVLNEVFLSEEYTLKTAEIPTHIFDIGANIGASVAWFALAYPNAQISAFEPNPTCFELLRLNTTAFGTRISLHKTAIAAIHSKLPFYENDEHWGGSLIERGHGDTHTVQAITLEEAQRLTTRPTVELVKIDIEGGEYAVASALAKLAPRYIIAEVHPDIVQQSYEVFRRSFSDYEDKAVYTHGIRRVIHLEKKSTHVT